jgi:hypothetical protein
MAGWNDNEALNNSVLPFYHRKKAMKSLVQVPGLFKKTMRNIGLEAT